MYDNISIGMGATGSNLKTLSSVKYGKYNIICVKKKGTFLVK